MASGLQTSSGSRHHFEGTLVARLEMITQSLGSSVSPEGRDLKQLIEVPSINTRRSGYTMTSMPTWGESHADDALWSIVSLMTELPNLNDESDQDLLRRAEEQGHHGRDSHAKDEQPSEPSAKGKVSRKTDATRDDHAHDSAGSHE